MDDDRVVQMAFEDNRILITNDKDLAGKIHRERPLHKGLILLRLGDERAPMKIDALQRLLERYADRLADHFVVVTETAIRFSRR